MFSGTLNLTKPLKNNKALIITNLKSQNTRRLSAINHFKWSLTNRHMVSCVIPVFSPRNPVWPCLGLIWSKTSQITLQAPIYDFCLPISLRMICWTHLQLQHPPLALSTPLCRDQTQENWLGEGKNLIYIIRRINND